MPRIRLIDALGIAVGVAAIILRAGLHHRVAVVDGCIATMVLFAAKKVYEDVQCQRRYAELKAIYGMPPVPTITSGHSRRMK